MNEDPTPDRTRSPVEVGLGAVVVGRGFGPPIFGFDSGAPRLLITRRPHGSVMAGWWELPGGKIHPGEDPQGCVVRELAEETGVLAEPFEALPVVVHTYDHATVRLHPWLCRLRPDSPEPRNLGIEAHEWVEPGDLARFRFLPANGPILERLAARLRGG